MECQEDNTSFQDKNGGLPMVSLSIYLPQINLSLFKIVMWICLYVATFLETPFMFLKCLWRLIIVLGEFAPMLTTKSPQEKLGIC